MSDETSHDMVVVGAGVAGSIVAKHLTRAGLRVLMLEARPRVREVARRLPRPPRDLLRGGGQGARSGLAAPGRGAPARHVGPLQGSGLFPAGGTEPLREHLHPDPGRLDPALARRRAADAAGGLRAALALRGRSRLAARYADLEPYYRKAERRSASRRTSRSSDTTACPSRTATTTRCTAFRRAIPTGGSPQAIDGMEVSVGGSAYPIRVRTYPAGRNSMPRGDYQPVGAVDERDDGRTVENFVGRRCAGNTVVHADLPDPGQVQRGQDARPGRPRQARSCSRAVASKVQVDPVTGEVTGIAYQRYDETGLRRPTGPQARVYVLAAHAVENAKLMLASGLGGPGGRVGQT